MNNTETQKNILLILFTEFFKIALFTIGGGLAMIPFIEETFVKKHKFLTHEEILDMITITQTVPGLIAINSAVFVGKKLAGTKGSFVSTVGVVLPSVLIIMIVAAFFPLETIKNAHILQGFSCVRACVLGLFIVLIYKVGKSLFKSIKDVILAAALVSILLLRLNPAITVLICCLAGGLYEIFFRPKDGEISKND